jgi:D-arginine dehydrogenase
MNYQCVIIGAGLAGAATAYHLARKKWGKVLLVEREAQAGVHSSGRNAGMIRQVISDPALLPLAREGALFLKNPLNDWRGSIAFDQNGSLLLGTGESWPKLIEESQRASEAGIPTEIWSPSKVLECVPVLEGGTFEGGVWSPEDGVVDAITLLSGYIQSAIDHGASVRFGSPVRRVRVQRGSIVGVETPSQFLRTEILVNAAGAWAQEIGEMAGAATVPFRPCRRHLFFSGILPWVDPKWPFVWDVAHQIYFRPESGGLLLSPCDEDLALPGIPKTESAIADLLAKRMKRYLPRLFDLPLQRSLAGLRTLTPDSRFVIGWDPNVTGFLWVAGLGGHGVTTSYAVGRLAAEMVMGPDRADGQAFSPTRFVDSHQI